jgi:cytosine/adenosine deaminase-related metal-dependent hydrolase
MALGLRGPEMTTMDVVAEDLRLADELGLRSSVHIETGGSGGRLTAALVEHGLLRDTTTFVHNNGISDDQLRMMADAGSSVSISPDVELKMGIGWPETGRLLAAGLRPTLSTDDYPSAGGDMFSAMRTAFVTQRGLDGSLNARELLEFATVDGATACGLADRTGSLTPGKDADVILLRADDLTVFPFNNPAGTIVAAGHPGLVDTVFVAGRMVKRDGALVGVQLPTLRARLVESRDRIAAAAGVAVDGSWRPRPESE